MWLTPLCAQALVSHCEQWISKFSLLLHDLASTELAEVYSYFEHNTTELRTTPKTLDDLAAQVQLQRALDAERTRTKARFEPLQGMFATLEKVWRLCHSHSCCCTLAAGVLQRMRLSWHLTCTHQPVPANLYIPCACCLSCATCPLLFPAPLGYASSSYVQYDVAVPDSQRAQLAGLPAAWAAFEAVLSEAGGSLESAKENFREKVRGMVDHFGSDVVELHAAFMAAAPFSDDGVTTEQVCLLSAAMQFCRADSRMHAMIAFACCRPSGRAIGDITGCSCLQHTLLAALRIQACRCSVSCHVCQYSAKIPGIVLESLQALARIAEQEAAVAAARARAADLRAGMDIFSIPPPPYQELAAMEAELGKLREVWGAVAQWDASFNSWKRSKFRDIQVRAPACVRTLSKEFGCADAAMNAVQAVLSGHSEADAGNQHFSQPALIPQAAR